MGAPTIQAMYTAIEWLMVNEGDARAHPGEPSEAEECHAVAKWIGERIDARLKDEARREAEAALAQDRRDRRLALNQASAIREVTRR